MWEILPWELKAWASVPDACCHSEGERDQTAHKSPRRRWSTSSLWALYLLPFAPSWKRRRWRRWNWRRKPVNIVIASNNWEWLIQIQPINELAKSFSETTITCPIKGFRPIKSICQIEIDSLRQVIVEWLKETKTDWLKQVDGIQLRPLYLYNRHCSQRIRTQTQTWLTRIIR